MTNTGKRSPQHMNTDCEYVCDACQKRDHPDGWLALRLSGDRRGLEVRRFEDRGPDDRFFCSERCAFERVRELLRGLRVAALEGDGPGGPFHPPALRRAVEKLKQRER